MDATCRWSATEAAILLLEHDAKMLLGARGLAVPEGVLAPADGGVTPAFNGPWVIKAQVPAGGRGKAGGVKLADTSDMLADAVGSIYGMTIKGFPVNEIRIERAVAEARELYLGLVLDPTCAEVIVMASEHGGSGIEEQAEKSIHRARARPERDALSAALSEVAGALSPDAVSAVTDAGSILIDAYLDLDATLIELNPLFLKSDGRWVAGDVRMDVDENALPRQPEIVDLLERRAAAYPDAIFKRDNGFDLVVVDPWGEVGLVTTGAGLSMQLIDEMTRRGIRPYNFCDIRSGQMRGDPARLIENFRRVLEGPRLRCVLVNIFAGITELGEFAELLLKALDEMPELDVPIVIRLVGNGEDRADAVLRASGRDLILERDLDRAIELCAEPERAHA